MVASRGAGLGLEEAVVDDVDGDEADTCEKERSLATGGGCEPLEGVLRLTGVSSVDHSYWSASRMFSREARRAGRIAASVPARMATTTNAASDL
jgi:hypothetical protein